MRALQEVQVGLVLSSTPALTEGLPDTQQYPWEGRPGSDTTSFNELAEGCWGGVSGWSRQ